MIQEIKTTNSNFFPILRERVDEYFRENNLSKYANNSLIIKAVIFLLVYFGCWTIVYLNPPVWILIAIIPIISLSEMGVAMNIMHDANHAALSRNAKINKLLGYSMNVLGLDRIIWIIQHNKLHHTHTNIDGMDGDIEAPNWLLRFSKYQKWRPQHKYQHIYCWFFYGLQLISWFLVGDFEKFSHYKKERLLQKEIKYSSNIHLLIMVVTKIFYIIYSLVIPMIILPYAWWAILLGWFTMLYLVGFLISMIFQLAHVVDDTIMVAERELNWHEHQLATTSDFAPTNKILSWFVGGLNFQAVHHLFANVCHTHYTDIRKIIEKTAQESNVNYHCYPTLWKAIKGHATHMRNMGRKT